MEVFVTIVNGSLAFVTESCVLNVTRTQDLHLVLLPMTLIRPLAWPYPLFHTVSFDIAMVVAHTMKMRLCYAFDIIYSQHLIVGQQVTPCPYGFSRVAFIWYSIILSCFVWEMLFRAFSYVSLVVTLVFKFSYTDQCEISIGVIHHDVYVWLSLWLQSLLISSESL